MAERRAAALALLALLTACDAPPPRAQRQWPITPAELGVAQAVPDPGAAAYARTCIACHGADGRGGAPASADARGGGTLTGADLTSPTGPLTKPDAALLESILNGTRGAIGVMPPHRGLLSAEEATQVLAYVRQRFGAGIVPASPEAQAAPDAGAPRDASAPH